MTKKAGWRIIYRRESHIAGKYKHIDSLVTLTKEQIGDLLERVTVFPKGRLEISLRFVDENRVKP